MRASSLPSRLDSVTTPPSDRRPDLGPDVDPKALEQRGQGAQPPRVVVVAREHHAGDALREEAGQEVEDDLLRLRRGRGGVEHVPGEKDGVHPLLDGDPRHLLEGGGVLVHPRAAAQRLAHVPVRGVQEAHQELRNPRKTSSSAPAATRASLRRVAQAGKGKRTSNGVGISGCWTIMVPGFRMPARPRPAAVEEAVLRPLRLRHVEPAHHPERGVGHDARLHLARRLLRPHEHDAQAAPALRDVEQDFLDGPRALARRVLVQLVEHHEDEGPRGAEALLLLEHPLQDRPYDEALRPVVQGVDVHDRDLLAPSSRGDGCRACPRRAPRMRCPTWRAEACSRRSNAATVPGAAGIGPLLGERAIVGLALREQLHERVEGFEPAPLDCDPRVASSPPPGGRRGASPRSGPPRTRAGSSRGRLPRTGSASSRSSTTSRSVQKKADTPSSRLPVAGRRSRELGPDGGEDLHAVERLVGQAELPIARAVFVLAAARSSGRGRAGPRP